MEAGIVLIILMFAMLFFLIGVIISRWIFRINDIINRLDSIVNLLQAGLNVEEIKKS